MKEIKCRDAGVDCDFVARGNTEEEVLAAAAEHGKKDHGMTELDNETKEKIRSLVKEVKAA